MLMEKNIRYLDTLNLFFLVMVGTFLLWRSMFCFSADWDFIAYHLPAALQHFDLSSFVPNSKIQSVLDGFPPLPHYLQGLMILISGRFESAQLLSFVGLFLLFAAAKIVLPDLRITWLGSALCTIPLFVLHVTTGYVDVWTNLLLTIAFMVLLAEEKEERHTRLLLVLLLSTTAAVLSKYQAWPLALLFSFVGAFKFRFLSWRRLFVWSVVFAAALSSWALRNTLYYSNPTYPVVPPIVGKALALKGEASFTSKKEHSKNIPLALKDSSQSSRYFISLFELTRLSDTGEAFSWTIDQAAAEGMNSYHHRMGGYFWLTILLLACGVLYLFQIERRSRFPIMVLGATMAVVSVLPQSHELRYYMCVPFIAHLILLSFESSFSAGGRVGLRLAYAGLALWVLIRVAPSDACHGHLFYAPADARDYWKSDAKPSSCIRTSYDRALFFAGPGFREYPAEHCR